MPKGVYPRTEYHRKIISASRKGVPSPNKGKSIHSKATRKKIGDASRLYWSKPEYREKMKKRYHGSFSAERKEKARIKFIGKNNPLWKDSPGYVSIHEWVKRHKGTPKTCEHCGIKRTTPRSIQWANKDHKYKRVLKDYIALCPKCHYKFDSLNNDRFLTCKLNTKNKSGKRGVSWCKDKNKWVAQINFMKKHIAKRFNSFKEAANFAEKTRNEIIFRTTDRVSEKIGGEETK